MRGKEVSTYPSVYTLRITPAYAGKSARRISRPPSPRGSPPPMRGKASSSVRVSTSKGSPPPMRGKVVCLCNVKRVIGITPAYAGKRTIVKSFFNGL